MTTKRFAVAVVDTQPPEWELELYIVTADTWQKAFNQSPATWWSISEDQTFEAARKEALKTYGCMIAVKECT